MQEGGHERTPSGAAVQRDDRNRRDEGYRHAKGARVGEFKDVCEDVVRALVAFVRRVARGMDEPYKSDVGHAAIRSITKVGSPEIVMRALTKKRPFGDWNANGMLLCGENGLYETSPDGEIKFRKARLDDHVYLTVGYDLPEDLAAVQATQKYTDFKEKITRTFRCDDTLVWILKALARIAFEGRVSWDTKLTIAGVAQRNSAKTTFFKFFLRMLSELDDGYATRVNFVTLTTEVGEHHGSVAALFCDMSFKRFAFADEGGERRGRPLAMARLKRIADGSGATVRKAHAPDNVRTEKFGILAIAANPSNFVNVWCSAATTCGTTVVAVATRSGSSARGRTTGRASSTRGSTPPDGRSCACCSRWTPPTPAAARSRS